MISCEEAAMLISERLDRRLPLRQRLALWAHLMMCRVCPRYDRQLRALHAAIHQYLRSERPAEAADQTLSHEARERVKAALRGPAG